MPDEHEISCIKIGKVEEVTHNGKVRIVNGNVCWKNGAYECVREDELRRAANV